jgi:hypothetical protein
MSATPLDERLRQIAKKAAEELMHSLPERVWVEGDGRMYGDFRGPERRRVRLTEMDAIRMLHGAHEKAHGIFSTL